MDAIDSEWRPPEDLPEPPAPSEEPPGPGEVPNPAPEEAPPLHDQRVSDRISRATPLRRKP